MKRLLLIAIILAFASQGWAANLMPNGSFEEGAWNLNYQSGYNAGQSIQSAITTEQAKIGTHSLKLMNWNDTAYASEGTVKIDTKWVRLAPNTQYTFSVYFKVTTAAGTYRIGMSVRNACRATHAITSVADVDGSHITVTTGTHHQLTTGDIILIDGTAGDIYEGQYAVTVTGDHTFTVHAVYSATTTGTVYVSSYKDYSAGVALLTPANVWNKSSVTFTTGQSTTHPYYFFTLFNNNPNVAVNIPIYIDDMQVEAGAAQSDPPVTLANVEVGVKMTSGGTEVIGNIYNDENPVAEFNLFNSSAGSLTKTVKYEVVNQYLEKSSTGSFSETLAGGAAATHNVTLTGLKYGTHSVISWIDGENGTMSETVFAYLPAIRTSAVDTNGVFGIHPNPYPSILSQAQKMGMKWARTLSPWAFARWSSVEQTKDVFETVQTTPQNFDDAGLTILMVLGPDSSYFPEWATFKSTDATMEIVAATDTISCSGDRVIDGDFSEAGLAAWSLGAGWVDGTGKASKTGDGTSVLEPATHIHAVVGATYRITYEVSGWSVGTVTLAYGGVSDTTRGGDGTYTVVITALTTGDLLFTPSNTARLSIDNVTASIALDEMFSVGDRIAVMSTNAADVNDTFTVESVDATTLVVNEDLTEEGHAGTVTILNLTHWNDYVSWVMTNYSPAATGNIKYYEVANEPGGDGVIQNCPKCLARMVKMARDTADGIDPTIKLVGWADQEWTFRDATITALLALDVAKPDLIDYLDGAFTYHLYDETNSSAADSASTYVPNDVWGWNTEIGKYSYPFNLLDPQEAFFKTNMAGWSTIGETGYSYWPEKNWENAGAKAAWVFFSSVMDHSSKFMYYDLRNQGKEDYAQYTAVNPNDTLKPMGATLAALAHFFDVPTEFGELVTTGAGATYIYYSWVDSGGKAWAILLKSDDAISQVTVTQAPANYLAYDIYGNPVTITGTTTSTFPFSRTPIFIKAVAYTEANMKTYFTVAGGATYAAKTDATPPQVVITNRHIGQATNGVTTRFRFRAQDFMESVPTELAPTRIQCRYSVSGGGLSKAFADDWSESVMWYDAAWSATNDYYFYVQCRDAAGNVRQTSVFNGEEITSLGTTFILQ